MSIARSRPAIREPLRALGADSRIPFQGRHIIPISHFFYLISQHDATQ